MFVQAQQWKHAVVLTLTYAIWILYDAFPHSGYAGSMLGDAEPAAAQAPCEMCACGEAFDILSHLVFIVQVKRMKYLQLGVLKGPYSFMKS